jgi:hypothetical protein
MMYILLGFCYKNNYMLTSTLIEDNNPFSFCIKIIESIIDLDVNTNELLMLFLNLHFKFKDINCSYKDNNTYNLTFENIFKDKDKDKDKDKEDNIFYITHSYKDLYNIYSYVINLDNMSFEMYSNNGCKLIVNLYDISEDTINEFMDLVLSYNNNNLKYHTF